MGQASADRLVNLSSPSTERVPLSGPGQDGATPLMLVSQVCERLRRVIEVVRVLPTVARLFLGYVLVLDIATIVTLFVKHEVSDLSPADSESIGGSVGGDADVFRWLIIFYAVFQYTVTFHAIYTQNEYTLAAAMVFILIECSFVTLDWKESYTGFRHTTFDIVMQWVAAGGAILLAVLAYRSMESFGWRPYRELGARADGLAIHSAYRFFSSCLAFDTFAATMQCLLSVSLLDWPVWLTTLNFLFCVGFPIMVYFPIRRAVKQERNSWLRIIAAFYVISFGVEVTIGVFSVLVMMGHVSYSRLSSHFPVGGVVFSAAMFAVLLRLLLAYRLYVVLRLGLNTGRLKELDRRSLHGEALGSGYGTQRSDYAYPAFEARDSAAASLRQSVGFNLGSLSSQTTPAAAFGGHTGSGSFGGVGTIPPTPQGFAPSSVPGGGNQSIPNLVTIEKAKTVALDGRSGE